MHSLQCIVLVVGGGFIDVLNRRYSCLIHRRRTLKGWLLTTWTEADMGIALHARDATARGYSQQVNVFCRDSYLKLNFCTMTGKMFVKTHGYGRWPVNHYTVRATMLATWQLTL